MAYVPDFTTWTPHQLLTELIDETAAQALRVKAGEPLPWTRRMEALVAEIESWMVPQATVSAATAGER